MALEEGLNSLRQLSFRERFELLHGPQFVISHLGGDDALHELADLLSAPIDGGRTA